MVNSITHFYIHAYYNRFDDMNIMKRNNGKICSHHECEAKYRKGLQDILVNNINVYPRKELLTIEKERRLQKIEGETKKATQLLAPFPPIRNIPWNICLFSEAEFPYPHTHGDTIFLPRSIMESLTYPDELYSVLIHEKIHIFQRLFPIETHEYIRNVLACDLIASHSIYDSDQTLNISSSIRVNPDTNTLLYYENDVDMSLDENKKIDNEFVSPDIIQANWKSIRDTSSDIIDNRDHPYEMMAYRLTDKILKKPDKNRNNMQEEDWISRYLHKR